MENLEAIYRRLRECVEKTVGCEMRTPRDFDYLSMRIFEMTRMNVSAMTLKRFWGYLGVANERQPRMTTLNALAVLVGYVDWQSMYERTATDGKVVSGFLVNKSIYANSLPQGIMIRILWKPDRAVLIRYDGHEMFTVLESVNSKLSVGDTFRCGTFIDGEPLYLSCLIHEGGMPTAYVCGKIGGVRCVILNES